MATTTIAEAELNDRKPKSLKLDRLRESVSAQTTMTPAGRSPPWMYPIRCHHL